MSLSYILKSGLAGSGRKRTICTRQLADLYRLEYPLLWKSVLICLLSGSAICTYLFSSSINTAGCCQEHHHELARFKIGVCVCVCR